MVPICDTCGKRARWVIIRRSPTFCDIEMSCGHTSVSSQDGATITHLAHQEAQ